MASFVFIRFAPLPTPPPPPPLPSTIIMAIVNLSIECRSPESKAQQTSDFTSLE